MFYLKFRLTEHHRLYLFGKKRVMRWTVHLDGGPRRVNHAAVRVGDFIYSFGGYCTGDDYRFNESIDVHVLHTQTLRWYVVPQRRDEAGTILKYPEVPFQR